MSIDADAIVPPIGRAADETQTEEDGWDRLGQFVDRVLPAELHVRLLWLLLIVSFGLRMIWLDKPPGALIFDEKYYVNAARVIAKIPPMEDMYQDKPLGLD